MMTGLMGHDDWTDGMFEPGLMGHDWTDGT